MYVPTRCGGIWALFWVAGWGFWRWEGWSGGGSDEREVESGCGEEMRNMGC